MATNPPDPDPCDLSSDDLQRYRDRLHQMTVCGRWLLVSALWLIVGIASLWGLRYPIGLMQEHFTWAALRYGLAYHPISALGLSLCIGMTISVLVWQSRNILFGLPKRDRQRLEQQVQRIYQQGASHPLWRWVIEPKK